ncbi:hypothetical protein ACSBOB_12275 [Mesorhizobium sp. ASY16-5R]|uniref:hypothetical protein n=1 Tax=Mesorhizobium sp. ASY16-5R TaxID=3445772 RepID=UPI003FA111CB
MKRFLVAAAMLLPALGSATAGPAAPFVPDTGEPAVIPAGGCHADVRRHYVPEYGRPVRHYHNRDCFPIRASGGGAVIADCHRDVRLHRIRGVQVWHRHVGRDCAVRVVSRSN